MSKTVVLAEMSGTVVEVRCAVGSDTVEGEELFVLDSMKMEIPLPAPRSGKVVELCVGVDDVVTDGQVMAVIETMA